MYPCGKSSHRAPHVCAIYIDLERRGFCWMPKAMLHSRQKGSRGSGKWGTLSVQSRGPALEGEGELERMGAWDRGFCWSSSGRCSLSLVWWAKHCFRRKEFYSVFLPVDQGAKYSFIHIFSHSFVDSFNKYLLKEYVKASFTKGHSCSVESYGDSSDPGHCLADVEMYKV